MRNEPRPTSAPDEPAAEPDQASADETRGQGHEAVADEVGLAADAEAGDGPGDEEHGEEQDEEHVDRADRLQERLAIPVLVAALASVPAVFLTLFDDPAQTVGSTINTLSGAVLIAEAVALFAVSENRLRWLRNNLWLVALAVVMVPAVLFAVGPVQLLRLVRVVGALRIIRVRRILKAGKIVRERAGLDRTWQRVVGFGVSLLVAGFVAVVLADPTSQTRQILDGAIGVAGVIPALLAGGVLAGATVIVVLARRDDEEGETEAPAADAGDGEAPERNADEQRAEGNAGDEPTGSRPDAPDEDVAG